MTVQEHAVVAEYVITRRTGFYMLCRLGLCLNDHKEDAYRETALAPSSDGSGVVTRHGDAPPLAPSAATTTGHEEAAR